MICNGEKADISGRVYLKFFVGNQNYSLSV